MKEYIDKNELLEVLESDLRHKKRFRADLVRNQEDGERLHRVEGQIDLINSYVRFVKKETQTFTEADFSKKTFCEVLLDELRELRTDIDKMQQQNEVGFGTTQDRIERVRDKLNEKPSVGAFGTVFGGINE